MVKIRFFISISLLLALLSACDRSPKPLFRLLDASETGVAFENTIVENDSVNVFSFMNIYTGAGVAVGDINNDGLTDIYLSGNMVSGRLYLNRGGMKFEDISESSGIINSRWGTGVTMVDINQDGLLDIYVCVSGPGKEKERANLLYINQGDLTFKEEASAYGLGDTRQSMHAAFFDYDKDNDLDMYLMINPAAYEYKVNTSAPRKTDGSSLSNDRLYRNEGNGHFQDVSMEAGILTEGYGLGLGISDINNDGWPDIYISNDFIGNDILYINQGNGTFRDEAGTRLNHSSYAGMGNDLADIDNDGLSDIMVLDMRPEDNERQKLIISSTGYDRFQMMVEAGYLPQYSRNTLQLNRGEAGFSEIGFLAGVSSTDWSWSPLLVDLDNDGFRDLYVTNGFLRDLGNLDYIHYQNVYDNPLGKAEAKIGQKLASIEALPPAKLVNYAYRNRGDKTFEDIREDWGFSDKSCSHGAAYADLDNDGDLDLVVNNVNQPSFIYENQSEAFDASNFLKLQLTGAKGNLQGIGSRIKIRTEAGEQFYEHYLSRGYESSVDPTIHLGLGKDSIVELEIWWPDGKYQKLEKLKANQLVQLQQEKAIPQILTKMKGYEHTIFREIADSLGVNFVHKEDGMADFKLQPILPHMHSRNGPGLAIADVNGDGLEDVFVGGAAGQAAALYLQEENGYKKTDWAFDKGPEDMGALFFDADGDGDEDLYVVSGGVTLNGNYQDRLYLNDGAGRFSTTNSLPEISASGSLVTAADFDKDGDLDLFIGGRVSPGNYPLPPSSYLLENMGSENGKNPLFREIQGQVAGWGKLGMVSAALWTDYDNDGWTDLLVSGEFMPIIFFKNNRGQLARDQTIQGIEKSEGWWNSIAAGDFDRDGDMDYLLGNLGLNNKYHASSEEPLCIYAKDFDKDGRVDPVMCYYQDGENYLAHSRDELISQISAMRVRFRTYESYAKATFDESFLPEELEGAYIVKSHRFETSYMENKGNGTFVISPLPVEVQAAPIEGIVVEDFDQDGKLDAILTGNSYGNEVSTGRYDAVKGIFLKGGGDGSFKVVPAEQSGIFNDFDGSGLSLARGPSAEFRIFSANSDGPLKVFGTRKQEDVTLLFRPSANDVFALIRYKDGGQEKRELYYGSGYLSQSTRTLSVNPLVAEIRITGQNGEERLMYQDE